MSRLELTLRRNVRTNEATIGSLTFPDGTTFYTLEDLPNTPKIPGKTRVPAGRHRIRHRKVLSPKTKQYRNDFNWFKWHLELQDVPGFTFIYIHIGNWARNTDGCILVGMGADTEESMITNSGTAFREVYTRISNHLDSGSKVWITITDEDEYREL